MRPHCPLLLLAAQARIVGGFSSSSTECPPPEKPGPVYAFMLETIGEMPGAFVPSAECFDPITLPALISSGHLEYAWVPWSTMDDERAPHGAFVYKMRKGSIIYKKIVSVDPDDPEATLKFGPQASIDGPQTFDEALAGSAGPGWPNALILTELKKSIQCTKAAISYTTKEPFAGYKAFTWAAGPFTVAGPNSECGSYVYEKKDGGLVYHSC